MISVWALRREALLSDCIVSPDVFIPMVDHLGEFVVPYTYCIPSNDSASAVSR
jgi:hypothetical protein